MPALRVFLDMGADVLERAKTKKAAPMLIVSSESDRSVGHREHEALFEAALQFEPKSWFVRFDTVLDIPHNMLTVAEGNEYRDLLIAITKAYVESNLTWAEVTEISDRIKQGNSFESAIAQMRLQQQVAPELSVAMTAGSIGV